MIRFSDFVRVQDFSLFVRVGFTFLNKPKNSVQLCSCNKCFIDDSDSRNQTGNQTDFDRSGD